MLEIKITNSSRIAEELELARHKINTYNVSADAFSAMSGLIAESLCMKYLASKGHSLSVPPTVQIAGKTYDSGDFAISGYVYDVKCCGATSNSIIYKPRQKVHIDFLVGMRCVRMRKSELLFELHGVHRYIKSDKMQVLPLTNFKNKAYLLESIQF